MYKVVETDNFGGDYPDEKFVNLPSCSKEDAEKLASLINELFCNYYGARRYWKVVPVGYELSPGFEP
jgi:hypothetical protein